VRPATPREFPSNAWLWFLFPCHYGGVRLASNGSNKCGGIIVDSLILDAAQRLALGDALGALKRVALRDDPPALALRGIALAQLGDLDRARELLKSAAKKFGAKSTLESARCLLAEAEIALAVRDLSVSAAEARRILPGHGDTANAAHAALIEARRLLLIGRLEQAEAALAEIDTSALAAPARAAYELASAGISARRLKANQAAQALHRAKTAAQKAAIPSLVAEVEAAQKALKAPAARLANRTITLSEVERILDSGALVVDACRFAATERQETCSLAKRPVIFQLLRALAESWPADVPRETLHERAFELPLQDFDDRQRIRVEIGRLRSALSPLASVIATKSGFALVPTAATEVKLLEPPVETGHAEVLAILSDGESWSSSALALALGVGQRTVQRALEDLAAQGQAQPVGKGRSLRWMAPLAFGFATTLLLPSPISSGQNKA